MPLPNTTVKQAWPKDKPYKLADSAGLHLLVQLNCSRYWRLKYCFAGKKKTLALGVYPEVSLAPARTARDQARLNLSNQLDSAEIPQR